MDVSAPIACSLEGDNARRRWRTWKEILTRRLHVDRSPLHLTIRFSGDDAVRSELTDLVAAERICCSFVGWALEDLDNEMVLTINGDPEGVAAMAESFGLD